MSTKMGILMSKRINKDDIDRFHDYKLYIPSRTIYMGGEEHNITEGDSGTDGAMAERAIKNLLILDSMSQDPITIIMNNIGGDEYHGGAIMDAVATCKSYITIKVFGHAMSMGSLILQMADERIMAPTSSQMIHYGTWGAHDHAKTAQKIAKEGERLDKWMEQVYLKRIKEKHPHFTLPRLQRLLDHDTYLTAQQSVDLGLADKVLGEEE